MAEIVENKEGFRVIRMSIEEAIHKCEFGFYNVSTNTTLLICDNCNKLMNNDNEVYYVAVLNRLFCKECYEEWYAHAIRYKEDAKYEERYFRSYANALGIKL